MSTLPQTALITKSIATSSSTSSLRRRGSLAFPIKNLRRYLALFSQQITVSASVIVKHPFSSPPVPTWPLHLAVIVEVLRSATDVYEHIFEDLSEIRHCVDFFFHYLPKLPQMQAISFHLPIPANGRGFGDVLAPLEAMENGARTVSGQWIWDSRVWDDISKRPFAQSALAKDPLAAREGEKVIMYLHGGGYCMCSSATHREMLWRISRATGRRIFALDYRLAPEHPYPAALQDVAHAFSHLTDGVRGCGFQPRDVTAAGDSAGGGLALALMMYQRDQGLPMPSQGLLLSPWLDLTMSCDSWVTNNIDYLPSPPKTDTNPIAFYCSGTRNIKTLTRQPYISPLWGDLEGLPPLLIQCGGLERLHDECILFMYKASGGKPFMSYNYPDHYHRHTHEQEREKNGGHSSRDQPQGGNDNKNVSGQGGEKKQSLGSLENRVELEMYPGMVHVFQAVPFLPETNTALQRMLEFMQRKEANADKALSLGLASVSTTTAPMATMTVATPTAATATALTDPETETVVELTDVVLEKEEDEKSEEEAVAAKTVQVDQEQVVIGLLVEKLVEQTSNTVATTAAKSVEEEAEQLELEGDIRREELEGEALMCQA
ncbi:hypothetical protein BGZ98_006033 [Dissophora globulifera]|nr:hypothetical protein BGZ98_006033 [Dissophora globulifera]